MNDNALLFVYGTLRRDSGHAMSRWLQGRAEWRGGACCEAARLYRVSWYPALVPAESGSASRVQGDLFRLHDDAATWPVLDEFEGVTGAADDEYERRRGEVLLDDGRRVCAWIYWYRRPVAGLQEITGGDWLRAP